MNLRLVPVHRPAGPDASDATHVTNFFVLDGLLTREWDAACDALRHLVLPAIALGTHPAGDHRPDHPGQRARGAQRGLRPHRRGQGPDRARRSAAGTCCATPCCRWSPRSACRPAACCSGAVLTETVFAFSGIGPFVAEVDQQARLSRAAGLHPGHRGRVRAGQPARRPLLRRHRPEGEGAMTTATQRYDADEDRPARRAWPSGDDERGGEPVAARRSGRLRRNPLAIVGAVILVAVLPGRAIFAPLLAPYDPRRPDLARRGPTPRLRPRPAAGALARHRPRSAATCFSRLIYGARQSLLVGVVSTLHRADRRRRCSACLARRASAAGSDDTCCMRFVDMLLSIPSLLLAISIVGAARPASLTSVMIAIGDRHTCRSSPGCCAARCSPSASSDYVLAAHVARACSKRDDRAAGTCCPTRWPGDRAGHADAGHRDHRGGRAVLPRPRQPRRRPCRSGARCSPTRRRYFDAAPGWRSTRRSRIIVAALGFTLLGEAMREALDPKYRR